MTQGRPARKAVFAASDLNSCGYQEGAQQARATERAQLGLTHSFTAFVHAVSTAHSIHGVTQALWAHNPSVEITAVEPEESAVLSGGPSGSHKIEGIGVGFIPPLWKPDMVNRIERVSTADAKAMSRKLARQRGVFAGTSTGANVVAALRVAERLGSSATVVTIACDAGMRYLSTDVFRQDD